MPSSLLCQTASTSDATPAATANSPTDAPGLATLSARLDALARALDDTRAQLAAAQAQIRELNNQLIAKDSSGASPTAAAQSLSTAVAELQEQQEVLASQVAQHEQIKVETSSKYPVRITGLLLFNAQRTEGTVDNPYAPTIAVPSYVSNVYGSLQGTLRQTVLGLDARGPTLAGASTSAELRTDFFGGLANYSSGASYNPSPSNQFLRLRTLEFRLEWPDAEAAVAYDSSILSPNTPTSIAAVGVPALAWSGNLWNWLPQVSVTRGLELGRDRKLEFSASLMDVPDPPSQTAGITAAERSRYPGSEVRFGYSAPHTRFGEISFGTGGYWSPHNYGNYGSVDAWAMTADYSISLPAHLSLTGLVYRGAALGGLGGGTFKDVISVPAPGDESYLEALHAAGGWSQLKFSPTQRLEFNAAFGTDESDANQLWRAGYAGMSAYTALARNQTVFGNVIYRPKYYLLFSAEYRYLRSWPISDAAVSAQIYSLTSGYQF
jgi:hypothetical protein